MAVELVDIEQGVLAGGLWHLKSQIIEEQEILYLRHKVAFSRHKEFRLGGDQLEDLTIISHDKSSSKDKLNIQFNVKALGTVNAVVKKDVFARLEKMIDQNKAAPTFTKEPTPLIQVVSISAVILLIGFIAQYFS